MDNIPGLSFRDTVRTVAAHRDLALYLNASSIPRSWWYTGLLAANHYLARYGRQLRRGPHPGIEISAAAGLRSLTLDAGSKPSGYRRHFELAHRHGDGHSGTVIHRATGLEVHLQTVYHTEEPIEGKLADGFYAPVEPFAWMVISLLASLVPPTRGEKVAEEDLYALDYLAYLMVGHPDFRQEIATLWSSRLFPGADPDPSEDAARLDEAFLRAHRGPRQRLGGELLRRWRDVTGPACADCRFDPSRPTARPWDLFTLVAMRKWRTPTMSR